MKDISIFVWTLAIGLFDIFLFHRLSNCDCHFDYFYEEVHYYICTFLENMLCLVVVILRAFLYTGYISSAADSENCTVLQILNVLLAWIPVVATVSASIWSICILPELFQKHSYEHSRWKTFCSIKTIKFISAFSGISYDDSCFYYLSKDGEKIILCFSPLVYIFMCFGAYRSDKKDRKKEQKEKRNGKEKILYETLISDLQKIKKENEVEASKCFNKAKKTFNNIK